MRKFWWYKYKKAVYSGNKEEAKRLLLKAIPDGTVIYKYCRGKNRNWDTTTQSKLWLCRADQFNDPFDCAFLYNCKSKEVYDKKTEYEIAVKENMEQLKRDKISKDLQQSVFISCFSENVTLYLCGVIMQMNTKEFVLDLI